MPIILGVVNANIVDTALEVKTSPTVFYGAKVSNRGSSRAFIQLHNVATGSVTPGTSVPAISIAVEPDSVNVDYALPVGVGPITFATALSVIATTTPVGATATEASMVDLNSFIG